jgi:hypothetical protein
LSNRSKKPAPRAADVKQLLGRPVRRLTESERAERVDFYEGSNVHATAVEPGSFARQPR